jgi:hypothetical protein
MVKDGSGPVTAAQRDVVTEEFLDLWLKDFGLFWEDMRKFVLAVSHGVGLSFETDEEALQIAHANWVARCAMWQRERLQQRSIGLSHVKILSLLLYQLASVDWATKFHKCSETPDGLNNPYTGKPRLVKDDTRLGIIEGGGTYLAFQFVIHMINWFEIPRTDRSVPFEFRLTPDLEHDLMLYLGSEIKDELALFLMLKCLYVRPGEGVN